MLHDCPSNARMPVVQRVKLTARRLVGRLSVSGHNAKMAWVARNFGEAVDELRGTCRRLEGDVVAHGRRLSVVQQTELPGLYARVARLEELQGIRTPSQQVTR